LHHLDAGSGDAGDVYHVVKWLPLRPNLMLTVDRSGSMVEPVDQVCSDTQATCCTFGGGFLGFPYDPGSPNDCKWKDLLTVLTDPTTGILPRYQATIRFGLAMFPGDAAQQGGNPCTVGSIFEDPVEYNGSYITNDLQTASPGGGTPTADTLNQLAQDPALNDPLHTPYVLIVTDGAPNCNTANASQCLACVADHSQCTGPQNSDGTSPFCNSDTEPPWNCERNGTDCLDGNGMLAAIKTLRSKGVVTIVLGLGSDTVDPNAYAILNAAAIAGGDPRQGSPSFYQASTAADLAMFINQIAQSVSQCKFQIEEAVPAGELLAFIDGTQVAADPMNGFSYNASLQLVTFNGTSCALVSNGQEHTVTFEAP
jgi:hypothetical protein